jgi:hypothetical protein
VERIRGGVDANAVAFGPAGRANAASAAADLRRAARHVAAATVIGIALCIDAARPALGQARATCRRANSELADLSRSAGDRATAAVRRIGVRIDAEHAAFGATVDFAWPALLGTSVLAGTAAASRAAAGSEGTTCAGGARASSARCSRCPS